MWGYIKLNRTVESKYKIIHARHNGIQERRMLSLALVLAQTQAQTQVVADVIINDHPAALKSSFSLDICPPHKHNQQYTLTPTTH